MSVGGALSVLGEALTLSVGLQFIGWAKWRARLAREEWERGDGPRNRELLEELARLNAEGAHFATAAREALSAAVEQIRREVK